MFFIPQRSMNNKKTKREKFKFMYTNIRGMKGKVNGLTQVLHEHEPQIFLLTETQLKSNTGIKIKGYTVYSKVRTENSGGGVAILAQ